MDILLAVDPAEQAGAVVGRLLLPVLGVVLLVVGFRRRDAARRSPVPQSDGKGLRIAGWIVLAVGVLGFLGQVATTAP